MTAFIFLVIHGEKELLHGSCPCNSPFFVGSDFDILSGRNFYGSIT